MKKIFLLPLIISFCMLVSCSKKDEDLTPPSEIAQAFSENLEIEGAIRHKGDIPVPSSGDYGLSVTASDTNVDIEVGTDFSLGIDMPASIKGGIIFLKMEGADDYFEIQLDDNNMPENMAQPESNRKLKTSSISTSCPICNFNLRCCPLMKCSEIRECPNNVPNAAKVEVYVASPPKKNGQPDRTQLNDKKNWSAPIIFTINIKVSIPECKEVESEVNKFLGLINTFQTNPTSASCKNLKTAALKMLEEMKKCPKFNNDPNLQAAVDAWKQIDCSGLD